MRRAGLVVWAVLIAGAGGARPQTLDQQAQALATIRTYVLAVCPPVEQQSRARQATVGAKISADLPGLIKKLVNLNAGVSGEYKTATSQGVLQQDLAKALEGQASCRVTLSMALIPRLLGTPQPVLTPNRPIAIAHVSPPQDRPSGGAPAPAPAKNGVVVRVFLKNNITSRDLVTLARLLPAYEVVLGRSGVDPAYEADTLLVNRDTVSPGDVVTVMEALRRLGVPIRSVQQLPLGGRREIEVGAITSDTGGRQLTLNLRPLDPQALGALHGPAFWRAAYNGVVQCPNFTEGCVADADGRPVRPAA